MSIWGKISGAVAGMTFAGPLGAILGVIAGHYFFDKSKYNNRIKYEQNKNNKTNNWENIKNNNFNKSKLKDNMIFTISIIVLSAKMAKVDGVVTSDEIIAFKEIFKIPKNEINNIAKLYNFAKRDDVDYRIYAKQIFNLFKNKKDILENIINGLFYIAKSDNVLHSKEINFLNNISKIFGFNQSEFDCIVARNGYKDNFGLVSGEGNPYKILGIKPGDSLVKIKQAYRKLVSENHPDKLIARGVPKEFIKIANEKLARINSAYDQIMK